MAKIRVPSKRNRDLTSRYTKLVRWQCANPDCVSGYSVEGHHITPFRKGGEDQLWNIVALCFDCHRHTKGLHSNFEKYKAKLFHFKTTQELRTIGFVLDEREKDFEDNLRKYMATLN